MIDREGLLPWIRDGVGVVLSGGGGKGAYQAGVIKCLADDGVPVRAVAGASVGALNGAILASAPDLGSAAARLDTIWRELAAAPPAELRIARALPTLVLGYYLSLLIGTGGRLPIADFLADFARLLRRGNWSLKDMVNDNPTIASMLRGLETRPEIIKNSCLEDLVRRFMDEDALACGMPLYVSVFRSHGTLIDLAWAAAAASGVIETPDAEFLHVQALSKTEYRRAILASAALPIIFEAQQLGGHTYTDGGLGGWLRVQGNTPITPLLRDAGCRTVIVTHLTDGSLWDRHAFPDTTVIEIRPVTPIARKGGLSDTLVFDPAAITAWIEQGYRDTERCLATVSNALESIAAGRNARAQRNAAFEMLIGLDLGKDVGSSSRD